MKRLDLYLLRSILGAIALVIAVFLALGALFLFMGQQDDIGTGAYSWVQAASFVLMNLPEQVWQLLPITAMIGALVGLGALMRGSELTIMRAAGWSIWRIARTALLAGALLAAAGAALGEWLAPPLAQLARQQKAVAKNAEVGLAGPAGAWVREGDRLVNVARQSAAERFGGLLIVELTPEFRLAAVARAAGVVAAESPAAQSRLHATRGALPEAGTPSEAGAANRHSWRLSQYAESRFTGQGVLAIRMPERTLSTSLSPELLGASNANPNQMTVRALWRVMRYLERNGLDSRAWEFAFWTRLARLAAIVFGVLLAVPFVFGSLRSAGSGSRAMVGVAVGIGFFLLQSLLENGVLVFALEPSLLAWLPTALLGGAALTLLATTR